MAEIGVSGSGRQNQRVIGDHAAVFEAQGRVMLSLAELRRVPNWQDLDLVLEPGGEEAA